MSENPAVSTLKKGYGEYTEGDSKVTYLLGIIVAAVFILEVAFTAIRSLDSIQILATGMFGVHPAIAWPLSPVLHRGFLHFGANLIGLLTVGVPIEKHWTRRRYSLFLVLTGYLTIAAGTGFMLIFSDSPVAFYGTSGVVYALAGYSLIHLFQSHIQFNLTEIVAAFIGFVALVSVVVDPFTGPYFEPLWINAGHASGLLIGAGAGWFGLGGKCPKNQFRGLLEKSEDRDCREE
jgi:membrane associated rhomboid family serine protease